MVKKYTPKENKTSINREDVRKDIRNIWEKIADNCVENINHFILVHFCLLLAVFIISPLIFFIILIFQIYLSIHLLNKQISFPLRTPKDLNMNDPTEEIEEEKETKTFWGGKKIKTIKHQHKGKGILFLGKANANNGRKTSYSNNEIWLSKDDATAHAFLLGTTGSGKTEVLYSVVQNFLCFGEAIAYGDGKASPKLPFSIWSLARKFGREDDFLVLNFITGDQDKELNYYEKQNYGQSNTLNPFAFASANFIVNLTSSLMSKATGEQSSWREKAINLLRTIANVLEYKQKKGDIIISPGLIRNYLQLEKMIDLYSEYTNNLLPKKIGEPVEIYLKTAIGWDGSDQIAEETRKQHSYLTGQFLQIFSMMTETYDFIFGYDYPDIDMVDVLLNNRILVVLIPTLEQSDSQVRTLGKIYIAMAQLMMAKNLGGQIEGNKEELLELRAFNSSFPSLIILDEIGYILSEGTAKAFAQAREFNFMLFSAAQDVPSMMKGEGKDEYRPMIANSRLKWCLGLEDPDETFNVVNKISGKEEVSKQTEFDRKKGFFDSLDSYDHSSTVKVVDEDILKLQHLQSLTKGKGFVFNKGKTIFNTPVYLPDEAKQTSKLNIRINRFLEIKKPSKIDDKSLLIKINKNKLEKISLINADTYYYMLINSEDFILLNEKLSTNSEEKINYKKINDIIDDNFIKIQTDSLNLNEIENKTNEIIKPTMDIDIIDLILTISDNNNPYY